MMLKILAIILYIIFGISTYFLWCALFPYDDIEDFFSYIPFLFWPITILGLIIAFIILEIASLGDSIREWSKNKKK